LKKLIYFLLSVSLFVSCKKEPVANFEVSGTTAVGGTLVFQNHSANATSYLWDFGDHTTSTLNIPTHVYKKPGQYIVMLSVKGDGGSAITDKTLDIAGITYSFRNNSSYDLPHFCSFYYSGNYVQNFVSHGTLAIGQESEITIAHSTEIEVGLYDNDIIYLIPKKFSLVNGSHNELIIDDAALLGSKKLTDNRLDGLIKEQLQKK
jgi:PKD repeat protein